MSFDRLSTRLFSSFAVVIVLILGAAAWLGEVRIRSFHRQQVEGQLQTAAELLSGPAADALAASANDGAGDAAFATRLAELGRLTGLRLTVVRVDGTVLADSMAQLPLANHADRPEIQRALAQGRGADERRSSTTGIPSHYLAVRVERAGQVLGTMRAAAELEAQQRALSALHQGLFLGGVLAFGLGLLASAVLTRRLARPLEAMVERARGFAQGELERRIRPRGPAETRALSEALNSMAERLAQRIQGERNARAELEAILSSMTEGVVAVDLQERILLMNRSAADMLGLDEPLAAGTVLWQRMRFPELERELRAVLRGGEGRQTDAVAPAGAGRQLSLSVAPVPAAGGAGGSRNGAVVLISDVSSVRQLEQMRIDFVANVSHELRTPLSAVMGALETLAEPGHNDQESARFLELAARNAVRLKMIVNDLLDLSSIEAQAGGLPLEPISVADPLRSAAAALAGAAQRKGVRLEVPPAGESDLVVPGNAQRLEQCFTNLIANAIHYTPGGGRVRARVLPGVSDVRVEVEDTGIGIPAEALPRVFERFYRVDRGRSRDTGGTGLGLAIVKHIVLAHGGRVDVESEEGRGSTFSVHLPRRKVS